MSQGQSETSPHTMPFQVQVSYDAFLAVFTEMVVAFEHDAGIADPVAFEKFFTWLYVRGGYTEQEARDILYHDILQASYGSREAIAHLKQEASDAFMELVRRAWKVGGGYTSWPNKGLALHDRHEQCLALEQQGLLQRVEEDESHILWKPTEATP